MKLKKIFSVYIPTRFGLIERKLKRIPIKSGKYKFALINCYDSYTQDHYNKVLGLVLRKGYIVIVVSTKLPLGAILRENLYHIVVEPRDIGTQTFELNEYKKFSFVLGLDSPGRTEMYRIAQRYRIPAISLEKIDRINSREIIIEDEYNGRERILIDTNYQASGRGLGDILIATPVIHQIKNQNLEAELTVSTRLIAKPLLKNNPHIDKLITEDYNEKVLLSILDDYDRHYFLGKMTEDYTVKRNQQPRVDSIAELFGVKLKNKVPEIYLTSEEEKIGQKYMAGNRINIVVAVEAIEKARRWHKKYLEKLIEIIDTKKINLIVVGKIPEEYKGNILNLTGRTSLIEMISVVYNSDYVITTDNIVSHIAGAFHKKTITMYTNIPADWRSRYYQNTVAVQSSVECSPCWNKYKYPRREHECNLECIEELRPEVVTQELNKMIGVNNYRKSVSELFTEDSKEAEIKLTRKESNIVYINLWRRFGDCLFAIPTVRALRKKFPNKKLVWGTHYYFYDIVKNLPYIDKYILFQGRMNQNWDEYIPNPNQQIVEFLQKLRPQKIYDLHISPKYNQDLKRQKLSIVEYVAYRLANLTYDELDKELEYFPDKNLEHKVNLDFQKFLKGYRGIVTYNLNCFSPKPRGIWNVAQQQELIKYFELAGYRMISIGHLSENVGKDDSYHFSSMDFVYYAIKFSDLFLGYDSGIRNLALSVPDSKIISLENSMAYENKSNIQSLSQKYNHVGIDIQKATPYEVFLKGISLIKNQQVNLSEYIEIKEKQFIRRRR